MAKFHWAKANRNEAVGYELAVPTNKEAVNAAAEFWLAKFPDRTDQNLSDEAVAYAVETVLDLNGLRFVELFNKNHELLYSGEHRLSQ